MMFNFIKKRFFKCCVCETTNWNFLGFNKIIGNNKICNHCWKLLHRRRNDGSVRISYDFLHKNKKKGGNE